ncbi:hypothetical protein BJY52DRAFT_835032 [Lactarius psammicola]|nr:hypothetical protein BJY52DRAFT_835032 [Lactarius psammicola]
MTPTATSPPPTPRTDKQQDDATGDLAELPARAGFDLAAMRAVVNGIEQGKANRHDLTRPTRPEISPPPPPSAMSAIWPRPRSTSPPPVTKFPDITPTIEHLSAMHNPTTTAVTSTSADPMSFRGIHDALPSEEDATSPSSSPSLSISPSRPRSDPTGDSALLSAGYDGVSWTPVSPDKEVYGGGFGTPFGNPFHPTPTPFTAMDQTRSSPSNVSNASLASPVVERDPWSSQTYSSNSTGAKKASSVFAVNPWES